MWKVPAFLVAVLTLMGIIWKTVLAGIVIASVTESVQADLQSDVEAVVKAQIDPVAAQVAASNAGLKATIQSAISQLEDDIAALEFRQSCRDAGCTWTSEDMQRLTNKRRRLGEQEDALEKIEKASESD